LRFFFIFLLSHPIHTPFKIPNIAPKTHPKHIPNIPQTYPKPIPNLSQTYPKPIPNLPRKSSYQALKSDWQEGQNVSEK